MPARISVVENILSANDELAVRNRAAFDRAAAEFPDELPRLQTRPSWLRPEDWELRLAGLRLIAGEAH